MKLSPKLLLPAGLLAGLAILAMAINLRSTPPVNATFDRARLVDVVTLEQVNLAPEVLGYGRVRPKVLWQAVSEVSGRVIYRHPELDKGRLLPAETLLLKVDPLEYELKLAQAEADRHGAKAQLTRLDQSQANLKASLSLEQGRLKLAKAELERKSSLKDRGLVSDSELDSQRQSLLAQEQLVQDLNNQLQLLPDDRKVAEASLRVAEAQVKDAERRLKQTEIRLPMDARIAEVNVEKDQVVNLGESLLEAHGIEIMEVRAHLALHDMRTLVAGFRQPGQGDMPEIRNAGLSAEIRLENRDEILSWPATVTAIHESVDPNRSTVGLTLEVEQDYRTINPASKPPLVNDLFVAAQILGREREVFAVPARALRGEEIYLMDEQSRLAKVPVQVLFRQGDKVAVSGELEAGQQVVLNDLIPAVAGMQLRLEAAQ